MKRITTILFSLILLTVNTQVFGQSMWGATQYGGYFNKGAVIETDNAGVLLNSYDFNSIEGENPLGGLIETSPKIYYGITKQGAEFDAGIIFKYDDNTGITSTMHVFDGDLGGSRPEARLHLASDGKLYGTTAFGGATDHGILFSFNPTTNTFVKLHDFNASTSGFIPLRQLAEPINGKLYGTCSAGGTNNGGTIWEFEIATGILTVKINCNDLTGTYSSSPMVSYGGKLYGTMASGSAGGSGNSGSLFEYDYINNTMNVLYAFDSFLNGSNPKEIVITSSGVIYGTTAFAGQYTFGTLYEYNLNTSTYTKLLDFDNGLYGRGPHGLTLDQNELIYGLFFSSGGGGIFSYDYSTSSFTRLLDFTTCANPDGQFIIENDRLLGVAQSGTAIAPGGVVYSYSISTDEYESLINFETPIAGSGPVGILVQMNPHLFIGATVSGGNYNSGVIYEFNNLNGEITLLHHFNDTLGGYPTAGMVKGTDGLLYGTTQSGGTAGKGVLYAFDHSTQTYSVKYNFTGTNDGSYPYGELTVGASNSFYGTTEGGGINDLGVIFQFFTGSQTLVKLHDFDGTDGGNPVGNLLLHSDGKLYGACESYGASSAGTLFSFETATTTFTKLHDFDFNITGSDPNGGLVPLNATKLIGTSSYGGPYMDGTLYEYDLSNSTLSVLANFDDTLTLGGPTGNLLHAANGLFYGTCNYGVSNADQGGVFEFNPVTNTITKKTLLNGLNGSSPYFCTLIQFDASIVGLDNLTESMEMNIYPNPTFGTIIIQAEEVIESIQLMDMNGRIIATVTPNTKQTEMDVTQLNSGIYFAKIQTISGKTSTQKISKN